VARGWDIPAVVGASGVVVHDGTVRIGDRTYAEGDMLSIDGSTGEVFEGFVDGVRVVMPEAATLLGWAHDLGIAIGGHERGGGSMPAPDPGAADGIGATTEDALRALSIKGFVTPESLAPALRTTSEQAEVLLDRLVAEGAAEPSGGMHRLTDAGKRRAAEALEADRERWGSSAAQSALDIFLDLDSGVKHVVTAWQMREMEGRQVLNDHSDAVYDARVLADLAALHAKAAAWLGSQIDGLQRLDLYRIRLDEAASRAAGGEPAYIASPRVDSYHSVWFELHEDLIRLAGRTREDEVAAGRA
jgi:pyruvate, orthophosphate dikinase